jgi:type IV pilus assembly protein PilW
VSALSAGTAAATLQLKRIKALRVGLIMRTSLPERDVVSPDTLAMFADVEGGTLTFSRTLTDLERHYRYRVVEATVPLRNNLLP